VDEDARKLTTVQENVQFLKEAYYLHQIISRHETIYSLLKQRKINGRYVVGGRANTDQ
jgi:hypothetical protein